MPLCSNVYLHDFSINTILNIVNQDVWEIPKSLASSTGTNNCDLDVPGMNVLSAVDNTEGPNAFSDIKFDVSVKTVLDAGGGKFDWNTRYLKTTKNIDLLVWDPYNRSVAHNKNVQRKVLDKKMDAATSMSVLNVIPELSLRLMHINMLWISLKREGVAYFKIWPGGGILKESYLSLLVDTNFQANTPASRFVREIEVIFGLGNVKIDSKIPNLVIAIKKSNEIKLSELAQIQEFSRKEAEQHKTRQQHVLQLIYARENLLTEFSLFKKVMSKNESYTFCDRYEHRLTNKK